MHFAVMPHPLMGTIIRMNYACLKSTYETFLFVHTLNISHLQLLIHGTSKIKENGISSPANNCRAYLYERARLEIKCYFLKLISSSYDVPVASYM